MPLESGPTDENEILFQQKLPPGDEWLTRKSDEISKEDQLTLLRAYKSGDIATYNEKRGNIQNNLLYEFGEEAAIAVMGGTTGVGIIGAGVRAVGRAAVKAASKKAAGTEVPSPKNQKTLEEQAKDARDLLKKETPKETPKRPLKKLKEKEEAIRNPKEEERVPKEEERVREEEEKRLREEEEKRLREEERVREEEEKRLREEEERLRKTKNPKNDKKGKIPKGPLAAALLPLLSGGGDDGDNGSIEGLSAIESTIPISTISGGDTGMVGEGSFGEEGSSSKNCLEALNKIHKVLIESKNINEKMSQDMAFFAKQSAHSDILGDLESANQSVRSTKNNEGRGYTGRRERDDDSKSSSLLQKVAQGVIGIAAALAALGLGSIAGNDNGENPETSEKIKPFELSDEIGSIAEKYETSNQGAGTISSGEGDKGGKSYGKHQLSLNEGTLGDYVKQSEYSKQFEGLEPGSEQFDEKWKDLAKTDENFAKDQKNFIQKTHFDPQMRKLQKSGIDLSKKGRAVQEALWSTSQGHGAGGGTSLIKNALKGKDPEMMSDAEIVSAIQDYKSENVATLYKSSPESTQRSMANRAQNEKEDLLKVAEMPQTIPTNSGNEELTEKPEFTYEKSEQKIDAEKLGPHDVVLFDDNQKLNHTESETTSETTSGGGSTTTTVSHSPLAIQQQKIVDEKQEEYDKIRGEALQKIKKEKPNIGIQEASKLADEETFREKRELDQIKEATKEDIKSGTGTSTTWENEPTVTKISKSGYSDETDEMKAKLAVLNTPEAIEERKKDPDHLAEVERQKSSYYKQKEPESKEIPIYQESELNTKLPSDYIPNKNRIPSKDPGFEVDVETGEEFLIENPLASPIFDESGSSLPSINETPSEIPAGEDDNSGLNGISDMFSNFGTMISDAIGGSGGDKKQAPMVVAPPAPDSAGGGGAMMNVRNDDPLLLTLQYGSLRTV